MRLLSAGTGSTYQLIRRLAGGETGAHEVRGPDGGRLVVKWELDRSSAAARRRAVGLTDRLRDAARWPVSRQSTVDVESCLFVIQDFQLGAPVTELSHDLVDRLLELHARRLGLARPEDGSLWPHPLIRTLTTGGAGYCRHETLHSYDRRTASLIEGIEGLGHGLDPDDLTAADVVHWDLHPGNLLQVGGELAAVVDTDFVTTGDAAFDLITMALTSLTHPCEAGVSDRLFTAAFGALSTPKRQAYVGHLLIRFLDWSIRRGRTAEVELWLAHAEGLLAA